MSISYEEALATLSAMFGPPWTQDSLDTVLRHYQGHMENTVDAILRHGDGDPQALIDTLMAGGKPEDATTSMDEQLARQLAQEERRRRQTRPTANNNNNRPPDPPAAPPTKQSRGTPTTLPADFLRIPGATVSTSTDNTTMDSDAALARMLQDELFSQELANNPEFAHLARGSPRTVGGRPTNVRAFSGSRMAASGHHIGEMPRRGYPGGSQPQGEGPNIMDRISGESFLLFLSMRVLCYVLVRSLFPCRL